MEYSSAESISEPEVVTEPAAETTDESVDSVEVAPEPPSSPERKPERELRLVFADFAPALPEALLLPDAINPDTEIIFDLQVIGDLIVNGRNTVPIAWLKERVPAFFRDEPLPPGCENLRFPWQKVLRLLATALTPAGDSEPPAISGLTPGGASFLLSHFRTRRDEDRQRRMEAEAAAARQAASVKRITSAKDCADQPATLMAIATTSATGVNVTKPDPTMSARARSASPAAAKGTDPEPDAQPDDAELTPEDLRRQRDLARREAARIKGDLERRLAAAIAELKAMTQERDKALIAESAARQGLDERYTQLEFEYSVQAKSLQRAITDLQAARAQIAELQKTLIDAGQNPVAAAQNFLAAAHNSAAAAHNPAPSAPVPKISGENLVPFVVAPAATPASPSIPVETPQRRGFLRILGKAALVMIFLGLAGIVAAIKVPAIAEALPDSLVSLAPPSLGLQKASAPKQAAPIVVDHRQIASSAVNSESAKPTQPAKLDFEAELRRAAGR
jgi:hypothetical protein